MGVTIISDGKQPLIGRVSFVLLKSSHSDLLRKQLAIKTGCIGKQASFQDRQTN